MVAASPQVSRSRYLAKLPARYLQAGDSAVDNEIEN